MKLTGCVAAAGVLLLVLCSSCGEKSAQDLQKGYADGRFDQEESLKFLEGGNEYQRQVAAQGLARYGDEKAIEPLVRHMHTDQFVSVRETCLIALLERADPSVVPEFVKRLEDQSKNIRMRAARALGKMRSDEAYAALQPALEDAEPEVRKAAVEALATYGEVDGKMEIFEKLAKLFEDEEAAVRRTAVEKVALSGGHATRDLLIPALDSEDFMVKRTAVEKLGELRAKKAVPKLIPILRVDNASLREEAARALGNIRARDAVEHIKELLKDENWDVRRAAVAALGMIGGTGHMDELINMLDDSDAEVRGLALDALEKVKVRSEAFKAKLRLMIHSDTHQSLRDKAQKLLDKIK